MSQRRITFDYSEGGKTYEIQVEDNGRGWELSIDGELCGYLSNPHWDHHKEMKAAVLDRIKAWTLTG